MKKTTLSILLLLMSLLTMAQSDNWYFSFSMGGSWPSGTFKESNLANSHSGYAQKGFALILDATYPLTNHWGVKGSVLINTNSVDNVAMETLLKNRINPAVSANNPDGLSYTANPWLWNSLVVGPVFTINLGPIFWDLQVQGGLNLTSLPQQKLQYNDPSLTSNKWFYTDKNTTTSNVSYGILTGTAFRFPISERLNLKAGLNYYFSSARIKYEQTRVSQQAESALIEKLGSGSSLIPIKMVTATIGFVYYLN
jgi:Outer membrane protein beta-barrel domain